MGKSSKITYVARHNCSLIAQHAVISVKTLSYHLTNERDYNATVSRLKINEINSTNVMLVTSAEFLNFYRNLLTN